MENYRREVTQLVEECEKKGIDILRIANELNVSQSAVYAWKNGVRIMHKKNFSKLKALAEGKLAQSQSPPPNQQHDEVLLGRITQLTTQIEMLQYSFGKLEGKLEEKCRHIEDTIERQHDFFLKAEHKKQQR